MLLWWIGNAILLFVVFPVVLALLNGILSPIQRIRTVVDDILANGVALTGLLDDLPALLAETDDTVEEIAIGATRYANGVESLLRA